jgi:molybdopterin-guanine dinucleotide biosynthesis protein B
MKIFALSGPDPKIRERLLESLVAELARRGVKVSVAVRMPEGFDMDKPGKDSFEHRRAGAREVVLASSERWALMAERPADPHGYLEILAARLSRAELLIADGFEENGHSRLLVLDPVAGARPSGRGTGGAGPGRGRLCAFVSPSAGDRPPRLPA